MKKIIILLSLATLWSCSQMSWPICCRKETQNSPVGIYSLDEEIYSGLYYAIAIYVNRFWSEPRDSGRCICRSQNIPDFYRHCVHGACRRCQHLAKLPKDKQDTFLKSLYDAGSGIGYTLGRTNMNSCDFSEWQLYLC